MLREVSRRLLGALPAGLDLEPHRRHASRRTKRAVARHGNVLAARSTSSSPTQAAGIFHLKDFHEPLRESAEIRRRLRDVYESCLDQRKFVVITSPVRFIPEEVERSILFLELRPPDLIELVEFLREEAPGYRRTTSFTRSRAHCRA